MGSVLALDEHLDQRLEDELDQIAGHLNSQHARLVDVTVRLLAHPGSWQVPGVHNIEQYLCWRTGISAAHAHQIAAIAARVDELPACMELFQRGELSLDQMAPSCTRTPAWADHRVAELAPMLTVRQLRRVLGKYRFPDPRTRPMRRTGRWSTPTPVGPDHRSRHRRQLRRCRRIRVGSGSETTAGSTCISTATNSAG